MPREFFRRFMPHPDRVRSGRWTRSLGRVLHQPALWHLNRHSAARGVGAGMFWGFIPVPGQMLFAAITAIKIRGNVALAVVMPWIAFFILFPGYYAAYRIGLLILHQSPMPNFLHELRISPTWLWTHRGALLPFLVGSLPVASMMGVAGYFSVHGVWRASVARRLTRRNERLKAQRQLQQQQQCEKLAV